MSTIIRELTDIQGVEVSAPTENPFTSSGAEAFASDAAYEVARPDPGVGEFYFNTTYGAMRYHNGTTWQFDKTTFTAQTDAATTGASVDLAPNTTDQIILFTQGSLTSIRSISPTNQRYLFLYNGQASNGITLKNEDGTATAANRIVTGTGSDFVIQTKQIVTLVYDEDSARWRLLTRPGIKLESFADDAAYATAHNPPAAGDRYWNTTLLCTREYDGVSWQNNKVLFSTENNTALTGSDQDLSPGRDQIIKVTNASLSSIRSVSPAVQGFLILVNGTGATVTIKNESSGATAANRIVTGTGVDLSVKDGASIILAYDTNSTRWRVTGGSGSGSGGSSGLNVCLSPNDTAGQYSASLGYGWYSSAATAASTTTTASECPLAPVVTTAIKITRTTVGSYDEYRWKMPTALKSNTIPISWLQQVQSGAVSGEFKVDVYVYTDSTYTDGTKTRKNLRSDSSSVTSIPAYSGFFGSGNSISFDTGSEDYYGMRITRVSGTNWLSLANVKIGPGDNGIAGANGEYETVTSFTIGGSAATPTPGTGATFYRNTYKAGRWAIIRYEFRQTVAGSHNSAGDYLLPLPTGLAIDYSRAGTVAVSEVGDSGGGTLRVNSVYFDARGDVLNLAAYVNKIVVSYSSDTIAPGTTWGANGSLSNAIVALSLTVRVPIVGWDDAVVVGPSSTQEYLSSSFTSFVADRSSLGTALPTTTPAGTSDSLSAGATPFAFPQQNGDFLRVEIQYGGSGPWIPTSMSLTISDLGYDGTNFFGLGFYWDGSAYQIVRGKYRAAGGSVAWSGIPAGTRYRIVKTASGIPAGIEHGQLHGGAQLYRAGYAPGYTGGTVGSGYIGEMNGTTRSGTGGSTQSTRTTTSVTAADTTIASITLNKGIYLISFNSFLSQSDGTTRRYYAYPNIGGTAVTNSWNTSIVSGVIGGLSGSFPAVISSDSTTINLIGAISSLSGTSTSNNHELFAIRIA